MSTAKKLPNEESSDIDELEFDVNDDWRNEGTGTHTNIFKDEDLEPDAEDLDIGGLSLDMNNDFAKESAKSHAVEQAKKSRLKKRTGKSETLEQLQAAVDGQSSGEEEEMEILTEEDKALVNDPIFTNRDDLYPQIHGNYFLLDHMVDGGMAKVCRARYLGEGDEADKMVAIKMVQEKFSSDEDFVQMFIDEIKVSFGLNHPNINTTFDYGKIGKNLFVSMEYIHGKDLMDLVDDLKATGKTIPVPMAIYITSKMCEALHYAHNFTNQLTGQKYNIVHRDISPHNVMVSYEGYVKVIDFGIAKADTNSTEEAEGTIKGKINYFAPEYLEGKKIDHRYDQFAVALTLWEMLTGDKAFKGEGQIQTLKTILACNPAKASLHNSDVTPALDKIIMKALSKDPKDRYKDMLGFNKELMKLLYQDFPDFHESDIAELMKEVFSDSYQGDLAKFKEFGKYSISEIVQKIQAYKEFQKRQAERAANAKGRDSESMFDFGFEEESISAKSKKGIESLVRSRKSKKGPKKERTPRSEGKRQKALATLLMDEEDDGDSSTSSAVQLPWIKIGFLGLIVLAYTQRDLIFSSSDNSVADSPVAVEEEVEEEQTQAAKPGLTTEELKEQMAKLIEKKKKETQAKLEIELKKAEELKKKDLEKSVVAQPKPKQQLQEKKVAAQNQDSASVAKAKGEKTTALKEQGQAVAKVAKPELTEDDKKELSSSERELAELKAKMDALIKKNNSALSGIDEQKIPGQQEAVADSQEEEQKKIKAIMASKLDELEDEEESAKAASTSGGLTGKFFKFIKTRRAFSWMFD